MRSHAGTLPLNPPMTPKSGLRSTAVATGCDTVLSTTPLSKNLPFARIVS